MEKAIELVKARLQTLEHLSKITGDPNIYWRVQEAEKILSILESSNIVEKGSEDAAS